MKNISNIITAVSNATIESSNLNSQNDCVMTQNEVAIAIGVSRVAVQQIETRAMLKLKRELKRRNLFTLDCLI